MYQVNIQKVFIMKGVSCSGKSTYAQKLAQNENAIIVSSDEIGAGLGLINEPNSPEIFNIMEQKASEYLRKGQNIILDATSLTKKRTNRWIQLAKRFKAEAICVFINIDDEQLDRQMEQRIKTRWTDKSIKDMQTLKFRMKTALQVPTLCDRFDDIILIQPNNKDLSSEWFTYFRGKEEAFLQTPSQFMWDLYYSGKMEEFIPELIPCVEFKQENTHHSLTLFEHMVKAADSVKLKTPEFVWAMCLHDIGKTYPGIKSRIARFKEPYLSFKKGIPYRMEIQDDKYLICGKEVPKELIITDGQFHYYCHENLSAQMAYRILDRLGFSKNFIVKVCSYIQYHMALPYGQEPTEKIIRSLQPIYDDLLIIRNADLNGK